MSNVDIVVRKEAIDLQMPNSTVSAILDAFGENAVQTTLERAPPSSPYGFTLVAKTPRKEKRFLMGCERILDGDRNEIGKVLIVDFHGEPRVLQEQLYGHKFDSTGSFIEEVSLDLTIR